MVVSLVGMTAFKIVAKVHIGKFRQKILFERKSNIFAKL